MSDHGRSLWVLGQKITGDSELCARSQYYTSDELSREIFNYNIMLYIGSFITSRVYNREYLYSELEVVHFHIVYNMSR